MKVDREYIKKLLEVFKSSEGPATDIEELSTKGIDCHEARFIYHLRLLNDDGLIEPVDGASLGYQESADGIPNWSVIPLRLTAKGELKVCESGKMAMPEKIDDQDWFLQSLVKVFDIPERSMGITLTVGGFLISGNLVGGKKYLDGIALDFSNASGSNELEIEVAQSFSEIISSAGEILYSENKDKDKPIKSSYIHLENARFFNTNGSPIPNNEGVWWRGRISEVSGFMLGLLND